MDNSRPQIAIFSGTFRNFGIRLQIFVKEIANFVVTVIILVNIFIKKYSCGLLLKPLSKCYKPFGCIKKPVKDLRN